MPVPCKDPSRRCIAHKSKTGEPCPNLAIKGGRVCRTHGGLAPQVKAKAKARLLEAADKMVAVLMEIALNKKEPAAARISAAKDLLNRAGIGLKEMAERGVTVTDTEISIVVVNTGGQPAAAADQAVSEVIDVEAVDTRVNGAVKALPPWAGSLGLGKEG